MKTTTKQLVHKPFPVNVLAATNALLAFAVMVAIVADSSQVNFSLGLVWDSLLFAGLLLVGLSCSLMILAKWVFKINSVWAYLRIALSFFFVGGLAIGGAALFEVYREFDQNGGRSALQAKHLFAMIIFVTIASFLIGLANLLVIWVLRGRHRRAKEK